ncbi:probable cation transporter HKT6 [Zingiber officinale]|uniref:probable cation transporter HKT6 n=1 Tax=Zingiber officinale TaxID=94328 RepID=UPI001C4D7876|nr:probable cation transporter HKT6 [Zingiber officinale]
MELLSCLSKKANKKLSSLKACSWRSLCFLFDFFLFCCDPFFIQICYFLLTSSFGFLALRILTPNSNAEQGHPRNLDLFFMSVSAATVSSMSTVEMESFSPAQHWVLVVLMFIGGEVFTSVLGLHFTNLKLKRESESSSSSNSTSIDKSLKFLGHVVFFYILFVNLSGVFLTLLYFSLVADARAVLRMKKIKVVLFSIFVTVSSFTNCGFTPNNENMAAFKSNSALLLILIPQILAGNTLFPLCLRLAIWVMKKTTKREEFGDVIRRPEVAEYYKHLFPRSHCAYLALTVAGFVLVQLLLLCQQEWSSPEIFHGMNAFRKLVAALFQSVNSRHAGESVFDISKLSPAILVLFVVMMYLPPYTYFIPEERDPPAWNSSNNRRRKLLLRSLHLSLLCFPVIFVIFISITERKSFSIDPLNFNIFNVVLEVISAHGNVGFSMGYSCDRLIRSDGRCEDVSYGFAGRWSGKGKMILMVAMLLGRLKKFQIEGGKAWNFG